MTFARRTLLLPFVPLYAGVVLAKRWLHDQGFLRQRRLNHPIISVGSLSAGGAGKTPVVLMLAHLLAQRGFAVRILTRGYGRAGSLTERVDAKGDATRFGDEPLFLARRATEAEVFVGRDRYRAGRLSERSDPARSNAVYILDDGFQHQKLARDVEILLITRQDLNDQLLPAGDLREPLRSIRRADFILLRDDEPDLPARIVSMFPFALPPLLTIRRFITLPATAENLEHPLLFSGLARPRGFIAMLADLGVNTDASRSFPDHHRYSMADIEDLVSVARRSGSDGFIMTEKDAVKLTSAMRSRLETIGPVAVAALDVEFADEASAIDAIVARLVPLATRQHEKIRT